MATIAIRNLTKRFGDTVAVSGLRIDVRAGAVTGLLGPNAAGKTTTLRILLGLIRPTSGTATIGGLPYHRLPAPTATVGAVLDGAHAHPGRRGRDHLRALAAAGGVAAARVDQLLDMVDLTAAAARRVGGYSLGMRQRLAIAAALLGDPQVLILDEPTNGLDPAGVRWLRDLLRGLADARRTVLVSSHQLSELARTVDDVIIIANGRVRAQATLADLLRSGPAASSPTASLEAAYLRLTAPAGRQEQ